MAYSSIALSRLVVAQDNEVEAVSLLADAIGSGSQEDIEVAEALWHEAKGLTDAARKAWEAFLPESLRDIDPYA